MSAALGMQAHQQARRKTPSALSMASLGPASGRDSPRPSQSVTMRLVTRCLVLGAIGVNCTLLYWAHSSSGAARTAQMPAPTPAAKSPSIWPNPRREIAWLGVDGNFESTSDERHSVAVAAMRGSPMQCSTPNKGFRGAKVLVTGLSRSGSTWQYNAVKKILEKAVVAAREAGHLEPMTTEGWEVQSAHADGDSEDFDACLGARLCVLKTHIFVPRLLLRVDVILSSHRDVRDVVLSSMLMFNACFSPTGKTRTERSHGVAVRFQAYAHWTPYACYDMTYETMMQNRTAEVVRLARAALQAGGEGFRTRLAEAVDARAVVDDVAALSKRQPEKCVANKKGGPARSCWDATTGFAEKHVHDQTSKPQAWARRVVLDEIQRRVPTCDVFTSMRKVKEGFGGWLQAHGYALDAPKSSADDADFLQGLGNTTTDGNATSWVANAATTSEEEEAAPSAETPSWITTAQLPLAQKYLMNKAAKDPSLLAVPAASADNDDAPSRVARAAHSRRRLQEFYPLDDDGDDESREATTVESTRATNSFVESLPEAEYLMDPGRELERAGFPALYPRFVHVVNPFARKDPHPQTTLGGEPVDEDKIAHETMAKAWRLARWYGLDVEIAAALRVGDARLDELASRWPTRRACISENGLDIHNGMRLPLLRDLLACADASESADYVILTNPDILVHPHFYLRVYQLVLDERRPLRTAWSITRRQIAPRDFKDIQDILTASGEPHLGHDTFVFPREWLEKIDAAALVPGFSPWGGAFLAMLTHLGRAIVLGDKKWTFHLAADGAPPGAANRSAMIKSQLLTKRAEVCENAPGTLFNARQAAAALAATLGESTVARCCCDLDAQSAPHATTRLPGPNAYFALDMLSGPRRPPIKPLGLSSYEYLWDRLGPDMTQSRCAALPGIQLLPPDELHQVVKSWCKDKRFELCGATRKPRTSDCARNDVRSTFQAELGDAVQTKGEPLTALVVYEKLPTPFEGGHVRVRQLVSWLCYQGHRVLLVHRDAKTPSHHQTNTTGTTFEPIPVDIGIEGCSYDSLAVFAVDEKMRAMTARELARQRVDVAILTVWFYRIEADPIPKIALPILTKLARLRQRKIKIALVSDDVQYERALAVGKQRKDPPDYWTRVRSHEIDFYSDPIVDVVFAISDDDKDAFALLQRTAKRRHLHHKPRRRLLNNATADDWRARKRRELATPPDLGVLPYVARIDAGTTKGGWEEHAKSVSKRFDLVFVGGGTFSNKAAVRWLLRAALPAVAALPDSEGGCPELRRAQLVLVGTFVWAEEARKACAEASLQRKAALVSLLCDPNRKDEKAGKFTKWIAPGVRALGRVDDVSAVLRKARVFVAPAVVASGISTKVWLAAEHGLPVATSFDGTRGLPKDARRDAARNLPPWTLIGRPTTRNHTAAPTDILSRESARRFAIDVSRVYCDKSTWRRHALASLTLVRCVPS